MKFVFFHFVMLLKVLSAAVRVIGTLAYLSLVGYIKWHCVKFFLHLFSNKVVNEDPHTKI